jgi:hypothetical protein
MMPKDTNGNTRDENTIARLARSCQEKDKQIADQDAYIAELEECMINFMQDNNGSSCTEKEAREELTKMREEVALEKIKQGNGKL